jgi:DNA-binding HxlR family transcriptional regulator
MSSTIRLTGRLEPRDGWVAERCSVARAFDVVRTRSAVLLLREAFYGTTRFGDFARRVGISEPVAAARLRELVDEGLLEQDEYREPGQRARPMYRLTQKGSELLPVLVALMDWGDRWAQDAGGPVTVRHADCGAAVHAELRCEAGHRVEAADLELAPAARR